MSGRYFSLGSCTSIVLPGFDHPTSFVFILGTAQAKSHRRRGWCTSSNQGETAFELLLGQRKTTTVTGETLEQAAVNCSLFLHNRQVPNREGKHHYLWVCGVQHHHQRGTSAARAVANAFYALKLDLPNGLTDRDAMENCRHWTFQFPDRMIIVNNVLDIHDCVLRNNLVFQLAQRGGGGTPVAFLVNIAHSNSPDHWVVVSLHADKRNTVRAHLYDQEGLAISRETFLLAKHLRDVACGASK